MKINRRIMYLRDNSFTPVGCVAISVSKNGKQVRYQCSILNPSDKFERSLARHIALGRLLEKPIRINGWDGNQNKYEITLAVMYDIVKSKNIPNRAKKAAKNWILKFERTESE